MQTFLGVRNAGTRDEPLKNVCLGGYVDPGFHQQKMLLHRHRAIIWGAFGVVWLNSRGWGCSKDYALCESADLLSFCTRAYPCLTKLDISLKLRGVCVWQYVMVLHRHRAIIWGAFGVFWLNSRGLGLL